MLSLLILYLDLTHLLKGDHKEVSGYKTRMSTISDLISLTKPRLSATVIFTAAGGWWLAPVESHWSVGFFAVLGTTLTVWAANTMNNYLERDSDLFMERTKDRPLPTKRMSPNTALLFGLILTAISLPMLVELTNPLAGLLAGLALISYVLVYTPMKRTSSLNTLVGAFPGALPPLIGWTAATNSLDIGGLLLFSVMMIWQIPHFLAIAIYRREEYAEAGLVMLPQVRGLQFTRAQMLFYTFILLPIPALLFIANTTSWATLVIGTGLSVLWFSQAVDGFKNKREDKWARKFFGTSLLYLLGIFGSIVIDGLMMMWGFV